jgi:hypothetical protein
VAVPAPATPRTCHSLNTLFDFAARDADGTLILKCFGYRSQYARVSASVAKACEDAGAMRLMIDENALQTGIGPGVAMNKVAGITRRLIEGLGDKYARTCLSQQSVRG